MAVTGCSSGTTGSASTGPAANTSTSVAASAQPTATSSVVPTAAASAEPSADASGGSGWIGDSLARSVMPKKEDIQTVTGAAVTKDPDIATYTDKELRLSATADPPSCTDAYALVWALTVPTNTKTFTGASYTIGNSAMVVSIADSSLTLEEAKALIDKCQTFSVQRTQNSAKYTIGDTLTQFSTKAELVASDTLAINVATNSQVLKDTSEACVGGDSISPTCLQSQSEQVNQVLRRVGPNLISTWGITTTDVGGSAPADTPITLAEVKAVADGVQQAVSQVASP
jgi:hypothetical protein